MILAVVFTGELRTVLWIAVIPAFLSVIVLWVGVREPKVQPAAGVKPRSVDLNVRAMPASFWVVCTVASVFMLSRFSEAFLVLVGTRAGLTPAFAPIALVAMNLAYLLSAYPVGRLSDRMEKPQLLVFGCAILAIANFTLAFASTPVLLVVGSLLWGLHMGFTEGIFAAMVANSAPKDLRGSAFGIFNLLRGLVLLAASVAAGFCGTRLGHRRPSGSPARSPLRRSWRSGWRGRTGERRDAIAGRMHVEGASGDCQSRPDLGVAHTAIRSDFFQALVSACPNLTGSARGRSDPGWRWCSCSAPWWPTASAVPGSRS